MSKLDKKIIFAIMLLTTMQCFADNATNHNEISRISVDEPLAQATSNKTIDIELNSKIRDDFFSINDYQTFIEKYEQLSVVGNNYANFYINSIELSCTTLQNKVIPDLVGANNNIDQFAIEDVIFKDQYSSSPTFVNHRWLLNQYQRCSRFLFNAPNKIIDLIIIDIEKSSHPDILQIKASEAFSTGSEIQGWTLLEKVINSHEGSALPQALATIKQRAQSSEKLNWPKDEILYSAWNLASCEFGNDCSASSELVLKCYRSSCEYAENYYELLGQKFSEDELQLITKLSGKLVALIKKNDFMSIRLGKYL